MRFPTPDPLEYAKFIVVVLLTIAVLQYTGLFTDGAGTINWQYLAALALVVPICTYVLTVIVANISWVPGWERMNRTPNE